MDGRASEGAGFGRESIQAAPARLVIGRQPGHSLARRTQQLFARSSKHDEAFLSDKYRAFRHQRGQRASTGTLHRKVLTYLLTEGESFALRLWFRHQYVCMRYVCVCVCVCLTSCSLHPPIDDDVRNCAAQDAHARSLARPPAIPESPQLWCVSHCQSLSLPASQPPAPIPARHSGMSPTHHYHRRHT